MNDQFDKRLVNRIAEVFDNFEDNSADENWEALRKRFPEKKKKRTAIWWYSSAAAILLLAGIWLSTDNQLIPNHEQKNAQKTERKNPDSQQKLLAGDSVLKSSDQNDAELNSPTSIRKSLIADNTGKAMKRNIVKKMRVKRSVPLSDETPNSISVFKSNEDLSPSLSDENILAAEEKSKMDLTIMALSPNSSKNTHSDLSLIKTAESTDSTKEPQTAATKSSDKELFPPELLGEQLAKLIQSDARNENKKPNKNILLSFFAGSYFNYADGSESSVNTGIGFTSDIKIAKRLKLSTGISLGRNSLKYEEKIPQSATSSFARLHESLFTPNSFDAPTEGKASLIATTPIRYSLNSYDAKLTGFDIPINLKYTLLERKNTIYVSSGISSNLFINESYTYSFDYQMNGTNTSTAPNEESSANFQSFDFARVLNFSFGFDYPVSKQTRISVEPFIKYPLSGLGVENLRFSAAGINLKFNFNHLK